MFTIGARSQERLSGVNPNILNLVYAAIKITKIDFGVAEYGGFRSSADQYKLFLDHKSHADGTINKSQHQTGRAVDFYALDPDTGKASWDKGLMAQVACAFFQAAKELNLKITWGGLFTSIDDYPHIELD